MTGYGRDISTVNDTTIRVEVRTVNHRFLDFTAKIPRSLLFIEDSLKQVVKSYFYRGHIDVYINLTGEGFIEKELRTDWSLLDQYINQLKQAQTCYQLEDDISVSMLSTLPELIQIQEKETYDNQLTEAIVQSTQQACNEVQAMRIAEGENISRDINHHLQNIQDGVEELKKTRHTVIEEYRNRIQERIKGFVAENAYIDQARMHQEIALLAEKGDITEELTRLQSHIDLFGETIRKEEPIGRTLDFIVQEMHRETNTIGSKSTDMRIGQSIVTLKGEIEKIKEQIQNIE